MEFILFAFQEAKVVMDKKKSILNVAFSIAFKVILLFINILTRRVLIKTIGNDFNGLNSLFLSIVGFLSVAELGVGTAISFSMYKPIVEHDDKKVAALYNLFRKVYLVIGIIILTAGIVLLPFLPFLVADFTSLNVNIYLTFVLMLVSVVITYGFSAKTSLINAYKNNYITTTISSICLILQYVLQIIVLFTTKSFELYLICRIIGVLVQWLSTSVIAKKKYGPILRTEEKVDPNTKMEVTKNVEAMFMHKIGGVLVNSADSIIISAFIGISALGKYSNYTTIMVAMVGVLGLFFTPLTSIIGHLFVKENNDVSIRYFNFLYTFNLIIGFIFFLGYYATIDGFVILLFGNDLIMPRAVSFTITLNYFIQFMRQSVLLFRDATGTFYNDRWKPVAEGIINVVLSLLFVYILPAEYKTVGVIAATIITNIFVCHLIEPFVLFKYGFNKSPKQYYFKNYISILLFPICMIALDFVCCPDNNAFVSILINGSLSLLISVIPLAIFIVASPDFRFFLGKISLRQRSKRFLKN